MLQNSLVIVADAACARLYRLAQTSCAESPLDPIEVAALNAAHDPRQLFAQRIARCAAEFAAHHACNPLIVAATPELLALLLVQLEGEVPNVYVRPLAGHFMQRPPNELMAELVQQYAGAGAEPMIQA